MRARALVVLLAVPALLLVAGPPAEAGSSAVAARVVDLSPGSATDGPVNCIPLGTNTSYGFSGMIYRDVRPFRLRRGDSIRFDLGGLDTQVVRRNIYFAAANVNPAPAVNQTPPGNPDDVVSQGVRALRWHQVVRDSQVPTMPHGNTVVGDYELRYRAQGGFTFHGGGLVVGFGGSPPGAFADTGCEQIEVTTVSADSSGHYYARFCSMANLTHAVLDVGCGGNGVALIGMVLRLAPR